MNIAINSIGDGRRPATVEASSRVGDPRFVFERDSHLARAT